MPSGAKKRKAAKKKKETLSTSNPPSPHDDGVKSNKDGNNKDTSDVGEVSRQKGEERPAVQIEGESVQKDGKIESDKQVRNGGSSGSSSSDSSSSSSDDESHDVITSGPPVLDVPPVVDSVKPADLLSETPAEPMTAAIIEEANVLVETPVVDQIAPLVEETEVKHAEEKTESCLEDKVEVVVDVADAASSTNEPEQTTLQFVDECVVQPNEDMLTPISVPVHNGVESETGSLAQPLLEHPEQKTSWKGCCGLCELFSGSSR